MTPPDYREQAERVMRDPCEHGEYKMSECLTCLASWASRIAEERD